MPTSGSVSLQHAAAAEPVDVDVALNLDGNRVQAEGRLSPDADGTRDEWTAQLDLPVLARLAPVLQLLPGANQSGLLEALNGSLTGNTTVRGRWPDMRSTGEAHSAALRAGPLNVSRADLRWTFGTQPDAPLDVVAGVEQASWGTQQVNATQLQLKGTPGNHDFQLRSELRGAEAPLRKVEMHYIGG